MEINNDTHTHNHKSIDKWLLRCFPFHFWGSRDFRFRLSIALQRLSAMISFEAYVLCDKMCLFHFVYIDYVRFVYVLIFRLQTIHLLIDTSQRMEASPKHMPNVIKFHGHIASSLHLVYIFH